MRDNAAVLSIREAAVSIPDHSFDQLMTRLRAGDDAAATEVFHRFAHRLIGLARSQLDHLIRQKVDPEDILQSVYQSFFTRHAQGHFEVDGWDSLWGLLTVITVRKCAYRRKYYRAACRDVERESAPDPAVAGAFDSVASDPTPSQAARLTETVEQVMRELVDREQDIFRLSLQGYDTEEISGRVGRTERTVQRVLKRIRQRLEQMHAEVSQV